MGLPALHADLDSRRALPARIAVEWSSGRVEVYDLRCGLPAACRLARDLSEASPSIVLAWVESASGALLYAAIDGRGQPRKESPMA